MICFEIAIPGIGLITKFSVVRIRTDVVPGPDGVEEVMGRYAWTSWRPGEIEGCYEEMTADEVMHDPNDPVEVLVHRVMQSWMKLRYPRQTVGAIVGATHTDGDIG